MGKGIIGVGIFGGAHDGGALRHGQLADILIEEHIGSRLNAGAVLRKAGQVQVGLNDLRLGVVFFHIQRPEDLTQLTRPARRAIHGTVIGDITHHLLGDGGSAGGGPAVEAGQTDLLQNGAEARLGGGEEVHAVVLPKALVLHRHGGIQQALRHLVIVHPNAVARVWIVSARQLGLTVIGIKDGGVLGLLHAQVQHLLVGIQGIKGPYRQDAPGHAHQHNAHQAYRCDGPQHLMAAGLFLLSAGVIGIRLRRLAGLGIFNSLVRLAVHPVPFFLKAQAATSFILRGRGKSAQKPPCGSMHIYDVIIAHFGRYVLLFFEFPPASDYSAKKCPYCH